MTIAAINGSPRDESASSREVISLLERLGGADLQWKYLSRLDRLPEEHIEEQVEELGGALSAVTASGAFPASP